MAVRATPRTPPAGFDFDRTAAADYLGLTESTLATWACQKKNLPYIRFANVAWYRKSDCDALLRQRVVKVA